MTLAATPTVVSYLGTGNTNNFPFIFPVFQNTDITVTVTSPTGTVTGLILSTDYSVSALNPSGAPPITGSITLINAGQAWLTGANLTTGWTLTIARVVALAQTSSIRNQGDFYQEFLEAALDYLMMAIQQIQTTLGTTTPGTLPAVFTSDINVVQAGAGVIVVTPNGLHSYRIGVANDGALYAQQIT